MGVRFFFCTLRVVVNYKLTTTKLLTKKGVIIVKKGNGEGSIYKETRNGKPYYRAQITIGISSDGKPIRKSFSGYKKSDVLQKMRDAQNSLERGVALDEKDTKFGDYFHMWLFAFKHNKVKPRTFERYESVYRLKIKPFPISSVKLKELSALKLQSYINSLIETETVTEKGAVDTFNLIKPCLNYAITQGLLPFGLVKGIILPKIRKTEGRRIFEADEQKKIIDHLLSQDVNVKNTALLFAFSTGVRLGELYAVCYSDIDFINKTIRINKQFQKNCYIEKNGKKTYKYECVETKTEESNRILPLPDILISKLILLRKNQPTPILNDDLIFHDGKGAPLERKVLQRHIKKIEESLNLPHVGMHGIRHSYATRLLEMDTPIKTVQALMGHSDLQTTMNIYIHVSEKMKKQAHEKVNQLFELN